MSTVEGVILVYNVSSRRSLSDLEEAFQSICTMTAPEKPVFRLLAAGYFFPLAFP